VPRQIPESLRLPLPVWAAHLTGELFKRMAHIDITHVPYCSVAAGDLIAGRVDAIFNTTASLLQVVRSGQVRGLAVSSGERFETAPELPAIAESVSGFDVTSSHGVFVPSKTLPGSWKKCTTILFLFLLNLP
jgi:tripartite-type tricarboxylate transporter receptor subunit TctC